LGKKKNVLFKWKTLKNLVIHSDGNWDSSANTKPMGVSSKMVF
jgi:hypothetical protein